MGRYTLSGIKIFSPTQLLSKHCIVKHSRAALSSSVQKTKSTIDPEDVKRHSKQAKYWWVPHGTMKLLHSYNLIRLRYISVRPTASISQLRQKVWYLLELPDFCEEIIVLKREDHEIPLTELRKGNDPQHPYVLEVWLPLKQRSSIVLNNMLTMGDNRTIGEDFGSPESIFQEKVNRVYGGVENETTKRNETMKTMHSMENKASIRKFLHSEYKKSDLSCKISTSSVFFKLHGRKSRDNFANMLLKIQSDLTTLNTKLSDLENRIHV